MPTYSDGEMRAIVGRALQIDSGRSERFTADQLRAIATELGISNQALEVALYEADSKTPRPGDEPARTPAPRRWARLLAIAALVVVTAGAVAIAARRVTETRVTEQAYTPRAVQASPAPTKTTTKTRTTTTKTAPTKAPPP